MVLARQPSPFQFGFIDIREQSRRGGCSPGAQQSHNETIWALKVISTFMVGLAKITIHFSPPIYTLLEVLLLLIRGYKDGGTGMRW